MSDWTERAISLDNSDRIYYKFLEKTGASKVSHLNIVLFGDPMDDSFLADVTVAKHIFAHGDNLAKISHSQYGDATLWWVIAWFNGKPTDFHCKIGDVLLVPHPVEDAILQAQERRNI